MKQRVITDDELDIISGGVSTPLYAQVNRSPVGPTYSHAYGMLSESMGPLSYADANSLIQRFNAPTGDALYRGGNDPTGTHGTVSQDGIPYFRDASGQPKLDWGGEVTLQHHDGWAKNTTDFAHPLEGQITRHLVYDGKTGEYSALTVGSGSGGYEMTRALAAGGANMGEVPPIGASALPLDPQQIGHTINPGLGFQSFSQLDAAMRTAAGIPDSFTTSTRAALDMTAQLGKQLETGDQARWDATGIGAQQRLLGDLSQQLSQQGQLDGTFALHQDGSVSHIRPGGAMETFVRDGEGHVVRERNDAFDAAARADAELSKVGASSAAAPEATEPVAPGGPAHSDDGDAAKADAIRQVESFEAALPTEPTETKPPEDPPAEEPTKSEE